MPQQYTGTLKFMSPRGFGFLRRDGGDADDYLHATALEAAGINPDSLKSGMRLAYDLVQDVKRNNMTKAANVALLDQ